MSFVLWSGTCFEATKSEGLSQIEEAKSETWKGRKPLDEKRKHQILQVAKVWKNQLLQCCNTTDWNGKWISRTTQCWQYQYLPLVHSLVACCSWQTTDIMMFRVLSSFDNKRCLKKSYLTHHLLRLNLVGWNLNDACFLVGFSPWSGDEHAEGVERAHWLELLALGFLGFVDSLKSCHKVYRRHLNLH